MTVAVVDALEVVQVEHGQRQAVTALMPGVDFVIEAFAPRRTVGQPGERIDQGLLALHLQVLAVALGLLLHMGHAFSQAFEACGHFLFAQVTLLLVFIHGAEQAFKVAFEHLLEAVQVGGVLHAALQAVHLLANLCVQLPRGQAAVGVAVAGDLQMPLECLETLVELLEISLELMLATVGDRQHQHGQVIQDRQQFVPIQTMGETLTHRLGLGLVTFGQGKIFQQAEQSAFNVLGHRAVGRFRRIGQGVGAVRLQLVRLGAFQHGGQRQAADGGLIRRFDWSRRRFDKGSECAFVSRLRNRWRLHVGLR